MVESNTLVRGTPIDVLVEASKNLDPSDRARQKSFSGPFNELYGTDMDHETGKLVREIHKFSGTAADTIETIDGIIDESYEQSDVLDLFQSLNTKFSDGFAPRERGSSVTKKSDRKSIKASTLHSLAGEEGDVYMAKTLTSMKKVRIAWDLHEDNVVIVVDDYDKWEDLLGWKKLKDLPHGRKQIRQELGDQLSNELLDDIAPKTAQSQSSSSSTSSSSKRRTTTATKDEVINVARDSKQRMRDKHTAKEIKEAFESDGQIGLTKRLILFPSDTDRNMTDNWWIAGSLPGTNGYSAIANCKQSTYEYLSDLPQVHHVDEYIEDLWKEQTVTTAEGIVLYEDIRDSCVVHVMKDDVYKRFVTDGIIGDLEAVIDDFVQDNVYRAPEIEDDHTYSITDGLTAFYLRPILRDDSTDAGREVNVLTTKASLANRVQYKTVNSLFGLYARACMPNWDFDSTEMEKLESMSYNLKLDDGGYEIIQTMKMLHDAGEQPFSKTPKARWSQ